MEIDTSTKPWEMNVNIMNSLHMLEQSMLANFVCVETNNLDISDLFGDMKVSTES